MILKLVSRFTIDEFLRLCRQGTYEPVNPGAAVLVDALVNIIPGLASIIEMNGSGFVLFFFSD